MPAAGILGWKRSKYYRPILHSSKSPETSWKTFSEYIKNTARKKFTRGATPCPRGWGARPTPWARPLPHGPPGGPPMTIFCYMKSFNDEKNDKPSSQTELRRHEAEPWRNQSRALAELFCRGNFPPGGGNHCHRHHERSSHGRGKSPSTSSPTPSPLKTLVHLLYPILDSKSGIGVSRLLVVLITPCS